MAEETGSVEWEKGTAQWLCMKVPATIRCKMWMLAELFYRIHHIPWDVLVRAPVLLFPNNFRSWIEAYAMAGDKWKWFSDLVQEQLQDPVLADFTIKYARELFSAHPSSAKFNQASVSSGLSGR
jgi:hypothetical protein